MSYKDKLLKTCFDEFSQADNFHEIRLAFDKLCDSADLNPSDDYPNFYKLLRSKLKGYWKAQTLFSKLDKKYNQKDYKKQLVCNTINVLIIGAGPCGLRCAIELALLGAKVVIIEKRDSFSRNNVLHLWPYVISDLNQLGAKKFFGLFCSGSINHISIKRLQSILLKVAFLFGIQVYENVAFVKLISPQDDYSSKVTADGDKVNSVFSQSNWQVKVSPDNHIVNDYKFDVLIGANGRSNLLEFKRKELRCKLAIAITVNFVNYNTPEEARVEQISGIVCIFNQQYFKSLYERTGIDLENIVYYKDETHYFVMTVKKHCLLTKKVLKQDYDNPELLLHSSNIDQFRLEDFAREAAMAATNYQLTNLEFSKNYKNKPDLAVFDFTRLFAAENASRIVERNGYPLLQSLIGDCLLEPFWPTGSGCALGFLSSLDAAWLVRRLGIIKSAYAQQQISDSQIIQLLLEAVAERENIYQRLSQITPRNMPPDFNSYTLNPKTRYSQCRMKVFGVEQIMHLYDTDQFVAKSELKTIISDMNNSKLKSVVTFNTKIKFRDKCDSYFLKEKLLRWFQIKLSHVSEKKNFSINSLNSIKSSKFPLLYLMNLYKPDTITMESVPGDDYVAAFGQILTLFENEFDINLDVNIKNKLLEEDDLVSDEFVQFLSDVRQKFKSIESKASAEQQYQVPFVTPDKKSAHHIKRLSSKRQVSRTTSPRLISAFVETAKKAVFTNFKREHEAKKQRNQTEDFDSGIIKTRCKEIMNKYAESNNNISLTESQRNAPVKRITYFSDKVFNFGDNIKKNEIIKSHHQNNLISDEDCCYFCKQKLDQAEREQVKKLTSYCKRCICVKCCQELKLGVYGQSSIIEPDTEKDRLNQGDAIKRNKNFLELTEEELQQLLKKCLLDLRRINDESDEDYNGSCEEQVDPNFVSLKENSVTSDDIISGSPIFCWPSKQVDVEKLLVNCRKIARSRRPLSDEVQQQGVTFVSSSSSEDNDEINRRQKELISLKLKESEPLKNAAVCQLNGSRVNENEDIKFGKKETRVTPTRLVDSAELNIKRVAPIMLDHKALTPLQLMPSSTTIDATATTSQSSGNISRKVNLKQDELHQKQQLLIDTSQSMTNIAAASSSTSVSASGGTSTIVNTTKQTTTSTANGLTVDTVLTTQPSMVASTTSSSATNSMRNLAKFKFCSEPPKPVSINPQHFISQMNQKKLQHVQLDFIIVSAEFISPTQESFVAGQIEYHKNACNSAQYGDAVYKSSTINADSYRRNLIERYHQTKSGVTTNQTRIAGRPPSIISNKSDKSSTNKNVIINYMNFLNTDEFKDIDSLSINTEDSILTEVSRQNYTNQQQKSRWIVEVNENKEQLLYDFNKNDAIKMKATLESDLEMISLLDSSLNNFNLTGVKPNLVAVERKCESSDIEIENSSASSKLQLSTNSEKETLNLPQENVHIHEINNNLSRGRSSFKRKSLKKSYPIVEDKSGNHNLTHHDKKTGHFNTGKEYHMTTPPRDVQIIDNRSKCVEVECSAEVSSSDNLVKFTDISEMCKDLESIEDSLGISEY